jgi:hypothetical protein
MDPWSLLCVTDTNKQLICHTTLSVKNSNEIN